MGKANVSIYLKPEAGGNSGVIEMGMWLEGGTMVISWDQFIDEWCMDLNRN